jgi:hypothetical protein
MEPEDVTRLLEAVDQIKRAVTILVPFQAFLAVMIVLTRRR